MFTGITKGTFPVSAVDRAPDLLRYSVALPRHLTEGLAIGASVCIDGVCQTVVELDLPNVTFEAIRETLELTTLGRLERGDLVSVERSFRVGDEIGGHEVSGHVRGTGEITQIEAEGSTYDLEIAVPVDWMKYILTKGFIAIDGSSLTVGETCLGADGTGRFRLHLIPETLRLTNLARKSVGDPVNVELESKTVTIVDTVERVLEQRAEKRAEAARP